MDIRLLRENRRHGTPRFPMSLYIQERKALDTILDNHWHDEAEFLWVISGQAVFQVGLTTYEIQAGQGVFVPSGEVHGGYSLQDSPCTYVAAVFHMDWFTESKDETATRYLQPLQREEAMLPSIYDETTEWGQAVIGHLTKVQRLFDSNDPAREMRIKAELYLIFADLITYEQWKRKDQAKAVDNDTIDRLKSVVAYVEDHCGQPITVSLLASHAGMSSGHFSRVFKTFMRKTPMEYVNQYRIQRAANLLQSSSITVAEAALEVGIDNFSYFSKRFKESYACTPMQFRKKFRSL